MADQPFVLAVASYASRLDAEEDFGSLWAFHGWAGMKPLAAAVVEKGTSGELEIDHHRSTHPDLPWGVALLGGALTAVAAPLGMAYLASRLDSRGDWAGAAAIVGRFWHHVPRDVLRKMSILLEAGQAGLVVVAVDHTGGGVAACLSTATRRVVSDSLQVDLMADFANAARQA